ncbi:hypothetical protein ACFWCF_19405 [Rhodococcus sp. NPDC060090]|uniref:hypothetical protein n=1 Tax=Rhodococcus sp. NPDC060090 TaxID=3347056 RepID=UPI00365F661A
MLRKLTVIAAVTTMMGLGSAGLAGAQATSVDGPLAMPDLTCVYNPIHPQCILAALAQTLSSMSSTGTGSAE